MELGGCSHDKTFFVGPDKHPQTHGQFVNARYARFTNSNPSSGFAPAWPPLGLGFFDLTPFDQKTGHLSMRVYQDPQKLILSNKQKHTCKHGHVRKPSASK